MKGQESLWGWLVAALFVALLGTGIVLIPDKHVWWFTAIGLSLMATGGLVVTICAVGLGVTAGMLRYDHLRARR